MSAMMPNAFAALDDRKENPDGSVAFSVLFIRTG
jgi:hypothetical protein